MKISVKAKPGAKKESMERIDQPMLDLGGPKSTMAKYKVSVKELAKDGKANETIRKALAKHFKVAPSRITLVRGIKSKSKIFEIK